MNIYVTIVVADKRNKNYIQFCIHISNNHSYFEIRNAFSRAFTFFLVWLFNQITVKIIIDR